MVLVRLESSRNYKDFRTVPLDMVVSSACITHVGSCIIAALVQNVHASDLSLSSSIFCFDCMRTGFAFNCIEPRRQSMAHYST